MRAGLLLASRALGRVAPAPAVGCIVTQDDMPVGRGWTQPGGRPHAEAMALQRAGDAAKGATVWVTLEPCAHEGRGPSCAGALIEAGVARVISAMRDPDPRTNGKGHQMLRAAGIEVIEGAAGKQARALNAGYLMRLEQNRPLVTLKIAASLDGRIAAADGSSQWITSPPARARGHMLRAQHDAVIVGSRTALKDNPSLTCRLPGGEALSPVRIVADSRLALPLTSKLLAGAAAGPPVWILARPEADPARRQAFAECGAEVIDVPPDKSGLMDMRAALTELAARGITRLLVEGGGHLAASFLQGKLVDRLAWFAAPLVLGREGAAAVAGLDTAALAEAPRFAETTFGAIGSDILIEGARRDEA